MSFLAQHKLIVIIALFVLGGGWYVLSGGGPPAPAPTLTTTTVGGTSPDKNLVSTLLALRSVKLDATILTDTAFLTLRDFSTQIIAEPVGRPDPFAPLNVTPSSSASSTHNAQIFSPRR